MNSENSQNDGATWRSDFKRSWKQRTTLEQKLMLLLALIGLILAILIICIIVKHAAGPKVCNTSGCLLAASQILTHVDPSADPCEDFFKFACGKFIEQTHGDMKASSVLQLTVKVERQLVEILDEPISADDNPWINSQKALFRACMNKTAVEQDSVEVFKEALRELNGWPVVIGYQWRESAFDWKDMVYKLKDRGYYHFMLLSVHADEDRIKNNRHIIRVTKPVIEEIKAERAQAYKKYMSEVAVFFGAERNRAALEMEKVFDFMNSLRKISNMNYFDSENETDTSFNETAVLLTMRFKVIEYQRLNSDIDWLEFINTLLHPVGKISNDDYVMFPKLEFTQAFFSLIHRTNKRTQANYIIWKILERIMPYMPSKLQERQDNYTCAVGTTQTKKTRIQFCKDKLRENYFVQPSDVMYARKYLPNPERKEVEQIARKVKSEFIEILQRTTWMDDESKTKALEKAKAIKDVIGAPGDYFSDVVFDQILGNDTESVSDGSFLRMLLAHNKIRNDMSLSKMHMNVDDTKLEGYYSYSSKVNAMYSFLDNVMLVPAALLQGIFYNPKRPMYLNYGALGSIIGHELTHGFCELGSKYGNEGEDTILWSNKTLDAYKAKTQCVIEEAESFTVAEDDNLINGTLTLEENVADYTGFKVSYAAYRNWVRAHGEEVRLPKVDYSPYQLFWISSVSYECFKQDDDKKYSAHAHNAFRAIGPLRNNPYFARDFNCPVGSRMNPKDKCQVF